MSTTIVTDNVDTAMMDYDMSTHAGGSNAEMSWTMEVQSDDHPHPHAHPEPGTTIEVDMEPDVLAEYEMGDDFGVYADDAIDVEVFDVDEPAAEVVTVGSPVDLDVPPAAPEVAHVDSIPLLTTPKLNQTNSFFANPALVPAPPPVPELPTPSAETFPSADAPPTFSDPTIPDPPPEVTEPPPDSAFAVLEGLVQNDLDPSTSAPPDALFHPEEVAPEVEASAEAVSSVLEDVVQTSIPDIHEPETVVPSEVEVNHPAETANVTTDHQDETTGDPSVEALEHSTTTAAQHSEETHTHEAHEPTPAAGEGDFHDHDEAPPTVLLSLTTSDPEWCIFSQAEHASDLPLMMQDHTNLFYEPIVHIFEALRLEEAVRQLPHALDGDMTIDAFDIDLSISEDNIYAREVTFHDLTLLHEGCGLSGPLRVRIYFTVSRFITRYQQLRDHVARLSLGEESAVPVTETAAPGLAQEGGTNASTSTAEQEVHVSEELAHEPDGETQTAEHIDESHQPEVATGAEEIHREEGGDDVPEDDGTGVYGTNVDTEYHPVSGPEATVLEGEDDYSEVLENPNDAGTADTTELDADLVHEEVVEGQEEGDPDADADGESEEFDGEDGSEGQEDDSAEALGQDTGEPTEYEDFAGYNEDDEERLEQDPEFYDEGDDEGLGEGEEGVGITGEESVEQARWDEAAESGEIPLFKPSQVASHGGVKSAENAEAPEGAGSDGGSGHEANAGLLPPDKSFENTGAADLQSYDPHPAEGNTTDLAAEGTDDSNTVSGPNGEFDADAALETAIFDEGADLIDDDKSSETLDDEEPDMSAFEIEEPKNEKLARSSTVSSSRMSKRGFGEVDSEGEQSTETSGGSPGSKRARAT